MDHIYCIDTLQSPLQVSKGGLTEILRRRGRTDKIQDTLLRPDSHLNSTRLLTTGKKNISVSGVEKYFQVVNAFVLMTLGFPTMFLMIQKLNNEVDQTVLSLGKALMNVNNPSKLHMQGGEVSCFGFWQLSVGSTIVFSVPCGQVWGFLISTPPGTYSSSWPATPPWSFSLFLRPNRGGVN